MRGYPPGTHELPGAVAARPLDHFSEVPFAPWCFVPLLSVSFLLSSCCPSSLSVFVRRTRPWRASSSCGLRRRASGVAGGGFHGPSSGRRVDFEQALGAVVRCRPVRVRGERRKARS